MSDRFTRIALGSAAALTLTVAAVVGGRLATPGPVQAAGTDIVPLFSGCNNVALTFDVGTTVGTVAAAVTPAPAVESVWRYDNAQARFFGYSSLPGAPNDYATVGARGEPVFICMREAGQLDRPTI